VSPEVSENIDVKGEGEGARRNNIYLVWPTELLTQSIITVVLF
jgi:hypothetical protein